MHRGEVRNAGGVTRCEAWLPLGACPREGLSRGAAGAVLPRYEPEVAAFLEEHGERLKMDPTQPCSEDQMKWETEARSARRSSRNQW